MQKEVRTAHSVVTLGAVPASTGGSFPDMRPNEKERMKFIRVGDTVKTVGPAQERQNPFTEE